MNKKGQLSLEMVQLFMVIILTLAVIAIAMFTALPALSSENVIERRTIDGQSFSNSTTTVNDTGGGRPAAITSLVDVTLGSIVAYNATGSPGQPKTPFNPNGTAIIDNGNFTVTDGRFLVAVNGLFNGTDVINVSATFKHTVPSRAVEVANFTTEGTTDFFSNVPTVFTILGAVVIILAIILIIVAVNKFGFSGRERANNL